MKDDTYVQSRKPGDGRAGRIRLSWSPILRSLPKIVRFSMVTRKDSLKASVLRHDCQNICFEDIPVK